MWVSDRLSGKTGSQCLPGVEERLFMMHDMMNESPSERFIGSIDTDTLVVDGNTLLLE